MDKFWIVSLGQRHLMGPSFSLHHPLVFVLEHFPTIDEDVIEASLPRLSN
jgi:hypothetical protein